jgi:hypothetical protein
LVSNRLGIAGSTNGQLCTSCGCIGPNEPGRCLDRARAAASAAALIISFIIQTLKGSAYIFSNEQDNKGICPSDARDGSLHTNLSTTGVET